MNTYVVSEADVKRLINSGYVSGVNAACDMQDAVAAGQARSMLDAIYCSWYHASQVEKVFGQEKSKGYIDFGNGVHATLRGKAFKSGEGGVDENS